MPELKDLLANECWVNVEVPNGSFQVAYRPGNTSMMRQAELHKKLRSISSQDNKDEIEIAKEIGEVLCQVVSNWDLTDGEQPLPITVDVMASVIPGTWIDPIMNAIGNDTKGRQEEKKRLNATSAVGSLPADKPAIAQNGIHSSEPRGTWA